ncbi:DNA translocase FtsK [Eubacterium sp.]|uniref:DNA translocase FtsK n=1 Tax=Eubacterium sp. TaxID=142586 RepID=UPI002FC8C57C
MAARKKTTARTSTKKKTRPSAKAQSKKTLHPDRKRQIWGAVVVLFSIYSAYAFSTATPNIVDKIIGKGFVTFMFGNVSMMVAIYGVVCGILLFTDKMRYYRKTVLIVFLMLMNFMIGFSLNMPKLLDNSMVDLFSLATLGGYGGIIGNVFAFLFTTIMGRVLTFILIIILFFIEAFLIFKINYPQAYGALKEKGFGMDKIKEKAAEVKEAKELRDKRKEAEERRLLEEQELIDEDYDDLFHRGETGEISVDTQYLDIGDVMEALDPEEAAAAQAERQARKQRVASTAPVDKAPEDVTIGSGFETIDRDAPVEEYQIPDVALLNPPLRRGGDKKTDVKKKARQIEETLKSFGVAAKIVGADVGPSITRFEVQPDPGVKVNKIVNLSDDLALNLATSDIRIEAPIPGKAAVGIEVPNAESEIVGLREIIEAPGFARTKATLPFALGKTLSGQNIIGDISKMPHMLIAGATGSGKSVCINTIIISLLYKLTPDELRFIMIDPKMVELNQYNNIPHLLIPVVTDPKKAAYALNWGIKEMTDRYQLFKDAGVRDIDGYNEKMLAAGEKKLPRIIIVVDELADLMMTSPKEVENAICRIAQLARACGIHLIIATQRPSVDVITGLIKANIPSRIAFSVASNTDSRTILDMAGAEKLLGKGDMLYFPVGKSKPLRVQCTYVSDAEINRVIGAIEGAAAPTFNAHIEDVIAGYSEKPDDTEETEDALFPQAVELAFTYNQISTSMVQRKLKVGYARAGRIVDELEQKGVISGPNGSKPRTLLTTREEYYHA